MTAAIGDLEIDIEDLVAEDDLVAVRATMRGVHAGPLMDLEPTGEAFEMAYMWFYRIDDGQIAELWSLPDGLGLLQQLGALDGGPENPPSTRRLRSWTIPIGHCTHAANGSGASARLGSPDWPVAVAVATVVTSHSPQRLLIRRRQLRRPPPHQRPHRLRGHRRRRSPPRNLAGRCSLMTRSIRGATDRRRPHNDGRRGLDVQHERTGAVLARRPRRLSFRR